MIDRATLDKALAPIVGDAPYILVYGEVGTEDTTIITTQEVSTTINILINVVNSLKDEGAQHVQ